MTPVEQRARERERLIQFTLDTFCELMESQQISNKDIADKLLTTPSDIARHLRGNSSFTVAQLAELAWACGYRAVVSFEPLSKEKK